MHAKIDSENDRLYGHHTNKIAPFATFSMSLSVETLECVSENVSKMFNSAPPISVSV